MKILSGWKVCLEACGLIAVALFSWSCAAQGYPPGGPVDEEGPQLVRTDPPSGATLSDPEVTFRIYFDEQVDPVSVPGSIRFKPDLAFTTRARGRRVEIKTTTPLEPDRVYILTLDRGIRDYRNNAMSSSLQLVYSTGGDIPVGAIFGRVMEVAPDDRVEVGLFMLGEEDMTYHLHHTVDLGNAGEFEFPYSPSGDYRVLALGGGFSSEAQHDTVLAQAMMRNRYAMPVRDSFSLLDGDTLFLMMRMSPPLAQPQIQGVDWLTPTYLQLTFTAPFAQGSSVDNLFSTRDPQVYGYLLPRTPEDTVVIDLGTGWNYLGEPYRIKPMAISVPTVIDTVPPFPILNGKKLLLKVTKDATPLRDEMATGSIAFSEPVIVSESFRLQLFGEDTLQLIVTQPDPLSIHFTVPQPRRYRSLGILHGGISDISENRLEDSLMVLELVYDQPEATGSIRGRVLGIEGPVVVEFLDAETHDRIAYTICNSVNYYLPAIRPGFYTVFAYELLGPEPLPYYGGMWYPFKRAARFSTFPKEIEVRARWEVDGIDINFRDDFQNGSQDE